MIDKIAEYELDYDKLDRQELDAVKRKTRSLKMKLRQFETQIADKLSSLDLEDSKDELFGRGRNSDDNQSLLRDNYLLEEAKAKLYGAQDITMNITGELSRNQGTMMRSLKYV